MSQQVDKSVMTTTVTLISGLVLLAVVLFMVAALLGVIGGVAPDDNSRKQAAVLERLVGRFKLDEATQQPSYAQARAPAAKPALLTRS